MIKCRNWTIVATLGLAVACTEDSPPGGTTEPTPAHCPARAPLGHQMSGPCCARVSNADRLDNPQFRVAGISVNQPAILDDSFIAGILQAFLDQETFNWIIDIQGSENDGQITARTGFGIRNPVTGSFAFDVDNEDLFPATITATLSDGVIRSEVYDDTILLPILDEDVQPGQSVDPSAVLPVNGLRVLSMPWDDERTCVGIRNQTLNRYETRILTDDGAGNELRLAASEFPVPPGEIEAYIRVDAARDVFVTDLQDNLCDIIACEMRVNCNDPEDYCGDVEQASWNSPPDALCDEEGCTRNPDDGAPICDPATTCNAWYLNLYFVAHGVEITN